VTAAARPAATATRARDAARPQIAHFLGVAKGSEEQLANALLLVAERRERDYEIAQMAPVLAGWSREHVRWLAPIVERYGITPSEHPERLRSAVLYGTRIGAMGALQDMQDLSLLAEHTEMAWTILFQAAKELHDDDLLRISGDARDHTKRQLRWFRTVLEHQAPEALAVPVNVRAEIAASVPKRGPFAVAALPDPLWGPVASGFLLLVVGALGVLVGRPWLLPSLGPTAVLVADAPAHPSARLWNTVVGHVGGLLAGFLAVAALNAWSAPVPLVDHVLPPVRVAAAVLAIVVTVLLGALLRASHPPAAATTLLVALGSLTTSEDAANLVLGVVLLALLGEVVRRVRLERVAPAARTAPSGSFVHRWLRRLGVGASA
jgi:hypothetical protein